MTMILGEYIKLTTNGERFCLYCIGGWRRVVHFDLGFGHGTSRTKMINLLQSVQRPRARTSFFSLEKKAHKAVVARDS